MGTVFPKARAYPRRVGSLGGPLRLDLRARQPPVAIAVPRLDEQPAAALGVDQQDGLPAVVQHLPGGGPVGRPPGPGRLGRATRRGAPGIAFSRLVGAGSSAASPSGSLALGGEHRSASLQQDRHVALERGSAESRKLGRSSARVGPCLGVGLGSVPDSASDSASGADAPALSEELCCSDWDRPPKLATARPPTPSTMTAAAAAPARGSQRRRRGTTLLGVGVDSHLVVAGVSGGATALGNEQGERLVEPGLDLGRDRFAVGAGPELGEQRADARPVLLVRVARDVVRLGIVLVIHVRSPPRAGRHADGIGLGSRAGWPVGPRWVCRGAGSRGRVS